MRRFLTIFALTIFLSLLLSFTLSCARNTSSGVPKTLGSTEGTTAPPVSSSTEEALPPPADDLIYMIREASGCGHPHERVFRNPISYENYIHLDYESPPQNINYERLEELFVLKLNDVYLKEYPDEAVISARTTNLKMTTYNGVCYLVADNIFFTLESNVEKSGENLVLLLPLSMVSTDG